jgi:hypothetical protein
MPFACLGGLFDQHAFMDFASFRKGRPAKPRIVAPIDGGLYERFRAVPRGLDFGGGSPRHVLEQVPLTRFRCRST